MLFLQAVGGGGVTYTTQLLNNTSISTINSLVFSSGGSPASGTYTYNFVIGDQTNLAINYAGTGDALGAISARNGAALNANISGLGSLAVSAPSGNLRAGVNASGSTTPIGGNLNLGGLSSFSADVNNLYVGTTSTGGVVGNSVNSSSITLPTGVTGSGTSSITVSNIVIYGGARSGTSSHLILGKSNTIYADTINLGSTGNTSNTQDIAFNSVANMPSGGSLTLAGRFGGKTNMNIGGGSGTANVDLSTNAILGGLNLTLGTVTVGAGGNISTFSFAAAGDTSSTMSVDSLNIGTNASGGSSGTVNIRGGNVTVSSQGMGITIGGFSGSGTLNLSGGTLDVQSGGIKSTSATGTTTATLSVSGGTVNLHGADIGSTSNIVDNVTYSGGVISNVHGVYAGTLSSGAGTSVQNLSLSGGKLALKGTGNSTAAYVAVDLSGGTFDLNSVNNTTTTLNGLTLSGSTLNLDFGGLNNADKITVGSAAYTDTLHVSGSNVINLSQVGGVSPGVYPLLTYTGAAQSLASLFTLNAPTMPGFTFTVTDGVTNPNELDLTIAALNPWLGTAGSEWTALGNWNSTYGVPNTTDAAAVFLDPAAGGTRNVTVEQMAMVGSVTLQSTGSYTISGNGGLSLSVSSGSGLISSSLANQTISTSVTLYSPTVVNVADNTLTLSGSLYGSVLMTKQGTGTLSLGAGAAYFTGGISIGAGTVAITDGTALQSTPVTMTGGTLNIAGKTATIPQISGSSTSTLDLAGGSLTVGTNSVSTTFSGPIISTGGGGMLTKDGTGTLTITGSNSYAGGTFIKVGTLSINGDAALGATTGAVRFGVSPDGTNFPWLTVTGNTTFNASRNFTIDSGAIATMNINASITATVAGIVSGNGYVNKLGNGTLVLNNAANSFSGANIYAGVLQATSDAALGSTAYGLQFLGSGTLQAGGSFSLNANRGIAITSTFTGTIDTQGNTLTIPGVISGSGILAKVGTGTLVLTGTNNYTGGTTVSEGTLRLGSTTALGGAGALIVNGGTFDVGPNSYLSFTNFSGTGGTIMTSTSGNYATLNFDHNTNATFAGNIQNGAGTLSLSKSGTGTLVLSGTNTFSGGATINSGGLIFANASAMGSQPVNVYNGMIGFGFTVDQSFLSSHISSSSNYNQFVLALGADSAGPLNFSSLGYAYAALRSYANATYSGTLTPNANVYNLGGGGGTLTLTGALTGANSVQVNPIYGQTGTVVLAGANTYSGGTTINAGGTLGISSLGNLGTGPLNFNGGKLQILGTGLTSLGSTNVNWSSFNGGFDVADPNAAFTVSNSINAAGAFTKTGKGTLVLSGSNALYSGVTVTGGTLVFANANAGFSGTTVVLGSTGSGSSTYGGRLLIKGDAANLASYRAALQTSYGTGTWNGYGAIQTSATSAIGYMDGATYLRLNGGSGAGYAGGVTVEAGDVLIKYTFAGDADLDGRITPSDYAQLDSAFLFHASNPQWWNGDFNYDSTVNYADYAIIDAAFTTQAGAALAADLVAAHTAQFGAPYVAMLDSMLAPSAVPEPASLALLGIGALGLLKRRR